MSGHSRWAQVKHRKAGADAKKGTLFSKLSRVISIAARDGGANPEANVKLRQAIDQARSAGLPKENIERALERAESSADVANLTAVEYEAFGPGGAALLISGLTDNANRTTHEVKKILAEHGGRWSDGGSVAWMFERKIIVSFASRKENAADMELALIDAGATDTAIADGQVEGIVAPETLSSFLARASAAGLAPSSQHLVWIATTTVALDPVKQAEVERLVNALEDHADITEVWTNMQE